MDGNRQHGVVNPKVLYEYGFQMCLSFMRVHSWPALRPRLAPVDMRIEALFGRYDVLCQHYRTIGYDLRDFLSEQGIVDALYSEVSPFVVERIDKYLGHELSWDREIRVVREVGLAQLLDRVQGDWDAVGEADREELIESNVLFPDPFCPASYRESASIWAFVQIRFPVVSPDEFELHRKYLSATLLRERASNIRSVYWSSAQASFHCALEIAADSIRELVSIIMYDLQGVPGRGVETATYIAIESVASGFMSIANLLAKSPTELYDETLRSFTDLWGRIEEIVTKHDPDSASRVREVSDKVKIQAVAQFARLNPVVDSVFEKTDDAQIIRAVMVARVSSTQGLIFREEHHFHDVGKHLGPCIERVLRGLLGRRAHARWATDKKAIQETLKVKSMSRDYFPEGMTGGEVANALRAWNTASPDDLILPDDLLTRWDSFRKLRDKASHERAVTFEEGVNGTYDGFCIIEQFFTLHKQYPERYAYVLGSDAGGVDKQG